MGVTILKTVDFFIMAFPYFIIQNVNLNGGHINILYIAPALTIMLETLNFEENHL